MKTGKIFLSFLSILTLYSPFSYATENLLIGVVNLSKVVSESKYGKQEQEGIEQIQSQMNTLMTDLKKQLSEIDAKLTNPEVVDSLSPAAEEELKGKRQALFEEAYRYEQQFSQMMNQAQMSFIQSISNHVSNASGSVAKKKNLSYILNKDACFYYKVESDVTTQVIAEMDNDFDKNNQSKEAPKLPSTPVAPKPEAKSGTKETSKEQAKSPSSAGTSSDAKKSNKTTSQASQTSSSLVPKKKGA